MTWPLTQWYSVEQKPVRQGFYFSLVVGYDQRPDMELAWWDGRRWRSDDGETWAHVTHWRGLAFNPASAVESDDADTPYGQPMRMGWWVPKP